MLVQEQSGLGWYSWQPEESPKGQISPPQVLTGWVLPGSVLWLCVLLGSTEGRAEQRLPVWSSAFVV